MLILQSCFDGRKSYRHSTMEVHSSESWLKTLYKHSLIRISLLCLILYRRESKRSPKIVTKTLTGLRKVLLFPKYKVGRPDTE
ncbi:hypothetical protein EB796_006658 [Bugula neritina]|uniref:Uncharacterized protein n=1 Tax=Bugula neritina TaxID=10212 RepID=A0A7J7K8R7_BUGNE|nr:hypothetical protein EB796_006658 [Bugula neritina]